MLASASDRADSDKKRLQEEARRLEATTSSLLRAIENAAVSGGAPDTLVARLRERETEKREAEARLHQITALSHMTDLDLRRDEQELARR